ncbi:hypothetical protein MKW98_015718, partial [Papaver atlanticum]
VVTAGNSHCLLFSRKGGWILSMVVVLRRTHFQPFSWMKLAVMDLLVWNLEIVTVIVICEVIRWAINHRLTVHKWLYMDTMLVASWKILCLTFDDSLVNINHRPRKWLAEELGAVTESREVAGDLITEAVLDQELLEKCMRRGNMPFIPGTPSC